MPADKDVTDRAECQHGHVTRAQALGAELSTSALHRRTVSGRLVRSHPEVYRVAGVPDSWRGRLFAAVVSAGPAAVASHRSAAELWGLDGCQRGIVELTVPPGYAPDRRGAVVHRVAALADCDRTTVDRIPATTVEATVVTATAVVAPGRVHDIVDSALVQGLTSARRIHATLDRWGCNGRRNAGVLAGVLGTRLGGDLPTEGRLERRLVSLLRRSGLPSPVVQHRVSLPRGTVRIDVAFPEALVAIECDGYRWHGGRSAWERDLARRTELATAGWLVLHFSWHDVTRRPVAVVASVRAALDHRGLQTQAR